MAVHCPPFWMHLIICSLLVVEVFPSWLSSRTLVLHQILTVWKVNRIDGIYDSDCCDKDFEYVGSQKVEYVGSQKVDCDEHQIPTPTLGCTFEALCVASNL